MNQDFSTSRAPYKVSGDNIQCRLDPLDYHVRLLFSLCAKSEICGSIEQEAMKLSDLEECITEIDSGSAEKVDSDDSIQPWN